jgi:hypothetical protein
MEEHGNVAQSSSAEWRTLGLLWIVYGMLRIAVSILLVLYSGVATVMFGALLTRVPDPFLLMEIFHFCYFAASFICVLSGIFGLLAGWALRARKRSERSLAVAASILSLSDLPLGTTLGIYTLVFFLR